MGRLDQKVAIITGANSGVGAATALLFAKEGAKVVLTARREAKLQEVIQQIQDIGGEAMYVVTDVSKVDDVKNLVNKTIEAYGSIDILVNNAGVLDKGLEPIDTFADEDLNKVMEINTKGAMYCTREVSPIMEKNKKGSIINVASVAGMLGCGGAAYVASKAAIVGITKHSALRFADKNIRCNAVCPGSVTTPMVAGMTPDNMNSDMFGAMMKHSDMSVPICTPDDIADILLFLASDESRAITGQAIIADYGSTL